MIARSLALALPLALTLGCIPAGGGGGDDPVPDASPRDDFGARLADAFTPPDAAPDPEDAAVDMADALLPDGPPPPPAAACANGLDDDRDGRVDYPDDPGCDDADDDDEADPPPAPQCSNQQDDDQDGRYDLDDPDCNGPLDPREAGDNRPTACSDGLDNDGDGDIDFPFDPGCLAAGHNTEADPSPLPACANELDDDQDGLTDFPDDPGCAGRGDESEDDPRRAPQCANGIDDDANGLIDYPEDTGCLAAGDPTEQSPCGATVPLIDLNAHLAANPAYDGQLDGRASGLVGTCGGAAGVEYAFRYVVDEVLDSLRFSTRHPETTVPVVMYRRDRCLGPDLACDRGTPDSPGVAFDLARPPLGEYIVVVDTGARDAVGTFRLTVDAVRPPACRNGTDDDGDGVTDLFDPGCAETEDPDETDPDTPPVCANGQDDDGDGQIDYPSDPDCPAAGGDREAPPCPLAVPYVIVGQQGGDFELPRTQGAGLAQPRCDQNVGAEALIAITLSEPSRVTVEVLTAGGVPAQGALYARSVCQDQQSELACRPQAQAGALTLDYLERGTTYVFFEQGFAAPANANTARVTIQSRLGACNDLADNDGDGRIDRDDPGCADGTGQSEDDPAVLPQCSDGIDNNDDGQIDYPADDGCVAAGDPEEEPPCRGVFYGDVCVAHVSAACVPGSARDLCAAQAGRVITLAEFRAINAAGWRRPDANYHTVTVDQYGQCPEGIGNVGIPGWGDYNHWNCGDVQNYCNRAVICVQ
ncbi:MAG: hypothetical protein H6705_07660 [Myxococcales bacterium]|nr:hypothetical protein [Myxococcales bacterium]